MNRFLLYGIWSTIIIALCIIVTCVIWLVYPYRVLSFTVGNGTFVETSVKSGGYLRMHQNSCKYKNIVSEINRQFVDGIVHQAPPTTNNRELGCHNNIEYIYVPKALPSGEYHLRTVISFQVNPIRKVSYTVATGVFTIVK